MYTKGIYMMHMKKARKNRNGSCCARNKYLFYYIYWPKIYCKSFFSLSRTILIKTGDLDIRDVLIMSKGLGILIVAGKMFSIAEGKGRAMSCHVASRRPLFGFIHPKGAAAVTLARGHRLAGKRDMSTCIVSSGA